jgi:UDP-2,3-diacylglucosamine hydrolase
VSSVIYFLSDAHFGTGPEELEARKRRHLSALCDRIKADRAGLYIMGDLFDFWFEYRTVVQTEHLSVISLLHDLRHAGVRITYIAGNHDHWIGRFFKDDLGIRVVKGRLELELDGKRFLLAHGDGEGRGDWGYKCLLRPLLRNPLSILLFSLLHPDVAVPFAGWISRTSRTRLNQPAVRVAAALRAAALAKLGRGIDYAVFGHCHLPELTRSGSGAYLNLGDFFSHFTYGVYRNGSLSLETNTLPS